MGQLKGPSKSVCENAAPPKAAPVKCKQALADGVWVGGWGIQWLHWPGRRTYALLSVRRQHPE